MVIFPANYRADIPMAFLLRYITQRPKGCRISQRGGHWGRFPILESLDTSKSDFISAVLSLMIEILLILKCPLQLLVNETIGLGCWLESRYYSSGPSCLKGG